MSEFMWDCHDKLGKMPLDGVKAAML